MDAYVPTVFSWLSCRRHDAYYVKWGGHIYLELFRYAQCVTVWDGFREDILWYNGPEVAYNFNIRHIYYRRD